MKTLIILFALLFAAQFSKAQLGPAPGAQFLSISSRQVSSKYDTVTLNTGKPKCRHEWAVKRQEQSDITCGVYHLGMTCPNDWIDIFRICKICLRHENIKETQYFVEDEYEATVKKLKK